MSLFGRADKELPLLTHAYQLDSESVDEVIAFAYPNARDWPTGLDEERIMLQDTQAVLRLAREVMDCLCDHGGITRMMAVSVERQVNKVKRQYRFQAGAWPDGKQTVLWDEVVPIGEVTAGYTTEHLETAYGWSSLHTEIITELDRLIADMARGKASLARCVECNSVYSVLRRGQQFCSHRCGNRVSRRERFRATRNGRSALD
jgi:hypothetical protein